MSVFNVENQWNLTDFLFSLKSRRPTFINEIFWFFQILYFLNVCPIFVCFVNNFDRSDGDMIYLILRKMMISTRCISAVVSCPTTKNLEWYLPGMLSQSCLAWIGLIAVFASMTKMGWHVLFILEFCSTFTLKWFTIMDFFSLSGAK